MHQILDVFNLRSLLSRMEAMLSLSLCVSYANCATPMKTIFLWVCESLLSSNDASVQKLFP